MYVRYVRRSLAGCGGRFHDWVNPTRSSGIRTVTVSVTVPTNQLDYCFSSGSIQRVAKTQLADNVFHCTVATSV